MMFQVMIECDDACPSWEPPKAHRNPFEDPVEAIREAEKMHDKLHYSWVQIVETSDDARNSSRFPK